MLTITATPPPKNFVDLPIGTIFRASAWGQTIGIKLDGQGFVAFSANSLFNGVMNDHQLRAEMDAGPIRVLGHLDVTRQQPDLIKMQGAPC